MTEAPIVRPARPDDAPLAAVVFRLSMGEFADHLFGHNGRAAEMALIRMFSRDAGRFGYKHASVVELNGRALGMVIAFPGADLTRLSLAAVRYMPMAFGANALNLIFRSLRLTSVREAEADEYYISNIAILPAVHGQGFGSLLLERVDKRARAAAFSKCSLLVSTDNQPAIKLYEKHGYKIVATRQDKNPFASYHRMVKKLDPLP
jgi:ribosomal protein S18 acetylase RimI-like enzyme